ncbi:uncharacterized protein [Diabrotica undecimpunctata]|uniref:uncharacterized protein n=1 Tax=Diabrotica undecimpunctata TaxID=50387 RepID=UPI003B64230A
MEQLYRGKKLVNLCKLDKMEANKQADNVPLPPKQDDSTVLQENYDPGLSISPDNKLQDITTEQSSSKNTIKNKLRSKSSVIYKEEDDNSERFKTFDGSSSDEFEPYDSDSSDSDNSEPSKIQKDNHITAESEHTLTV